MRPVGVRILIKERKKYLFRSLYTKNPTSFDLSDFFIHCESNGISSRFSVYLITEGAYHQPQAVSSFAMMIYNGKPLVIYNSCGIDDIHAYGVIEYGSSNPSLMLYAHTVLGDTDLVSFLRCLSDFVDKAILL